MPLSRSATTELLAGLLLLLLNAILIWPLFAVEYPASFFSIEGAFIGIARHIQQHPGQLSWFPWWYGGIPFPHAYPPFSHALTAFWASLSGNSVARAYHQVAATAYCLIPVALYALARSLRAERLPSIVAGLGISLVSPAAILFGSIRGDLGEWNLARRLHVLIAYGEGPHMVSILFCLVTLALLARVFAVPRAHWFVLASLGCGATALSNWLGAVALAFGALALLLAMEDPFRRRRWLHAVGIAFLAYGIASPWMPPSTIAAIRRNAPFVEGRFEVSALTMVYGLAVALGVATLLWVLRTMGANRAVRFAVLWAWMLGVVVALARKPGIALLPQPIRYHIEMEIALLLALVLAGYWFFQEALDRQRWAIGWLALLTILGAWQIPTYYVYARGLIQQGDGDSSVEAQTARWLARELPGERAWLPGSVAYWANAFADVPQFGGGFDNGIQNPATMGVNYQIYSSEGAGERDGEIAVTWLKAYGVRAVQVSLPDSPEYFHPFRNPAKFNGLLEPIWGHRKMRMYAVPARHEGLAFVVPDAALPSNRPHDGLDVGEAERYVAALEDSSLPVTQFAWRGLGEAAIQARVGEGQAVSVQVSHHPGWEAFAGGRKLPLEEDGLGQIVLRPGAGEHAIRLVFTGGMEQTLARLACAISLLIFLVLLVPPLRKRAAALAPVRGLLQRL
ncbi:MAG: hypothetical protein U5J83_05210 [Bryobacterales bacterium]|nr:hypothetical protein [Bryobacterales bacterium]